jgi:hypothetical protein
MQKGGNFMKRSELRVLALFAIIGGVLQVLVMISNNWLDNDNVAIDMGTGIMDLISGILITLGLVALFAYQRNTNVNTFISFIAATIGTVLLACVKFIDAFIIPTLKEHAPSLVESGPPSPANEGMMIAYALFSLGWIYYGVSSFLAKEPPRTGAVLVAIAPITTFIPIPIFIAPALLGIGIIWLSLAVYKTQSS